MTKSASALDALKVEGRRTRGRQRLRWQDCVKRELVGVENEGEGVEMIGGDGSETGLVMKKKGRGKQKSTTGVGASLTPDYRDKEESNNCYCVRMICNLIL